jgi:hypothetical protein
MKMNDTDRTLPNRHNASEMQADINHLRQKARARAIEERLLDELSGKKCPPTAVLAYVMDLQDKTLLDALEKHTMQCEQCKKRLSDLQTVQAKGISLDLDIPRRNSNKYELNSEALQMVVRQAKTYLEIVNHTGTQTSNMPKRISAYVQSGTENPMVVVKKDMPSYGLSIHVAMSGKFNEAQGEARFCAMKADVEKYIKGMKISLAGEDNSVDKRTDKNGCADFGGMKKGKYELWSGDKLIASIKIK